MQAVNDNGRAPDLAQAASALAVGRYRLVFQVAAYFLVALLIGALPGITNWFASMFGVS